MTSIPRTAEWCSRCINNGHFYCDDHRDKHGEKKPYTGADVYKPSDFVLETVGNLYESDDRLYECFGYDPRQGFWVKTVDGKEPFRSVNISERAIGRTFHRRKRPENHLRPDRIEDLQHVIKHLRALSDFDGTRISMIAVTNRQALTLLALIKEHQDRESAKQDHGQ